MKKVLFVTYGSGHVRMVVPVAQALAESGLAEVQVLALTTAAQVARAAGLDVLQLRDFVTPDDAAALDRGAKLMQAMDGPIADPAETRAYLGLCYEELEREVGPEEAARRYRRDGRQAFLPQAVLRRIISKVAPALVVATNSPRAERASIMAARELGVPSICIVDLFCLDETWIWDRAYADRVCVLNDGVKRFLIDAGRDPAQVAVTGNPAFDALADPGNAAAGERLRAARGWGARRVLLWPTQVEPAFHPFNGQPGNPELPRLALREVVAWVAAQNDVVLCVRPRAGEAPPGLPDDPRFTVAGQDIALAHLLHAVDLVVTLNSTVGLEGHLAGKRLVQVLGSVFDAAMPLADYGIADEAVHLGGIGSALERCLALPRAAGARQAGHAALRVLDVIRSFL
ncbi:MAG: UDP-glycosyltransferase [Comamonadaceae bacterium]|nr:MAG: UDP-glycosyltransferase [Comamonadaceae bacterium]